MNPGPEITQPVTIEELERFWSEALVPLLPTPVIPPDYARDHGPPPPRSEITIELPAGLGAAAARLAHSKPSVLLAMLLAACDVLLQRHGDAEQICVLTPVTDPALGDAGTNRWLAVKTTVAPDAPLSDLLQRVGLDLAAAFAHQHFPFARVLELLGRNWPPNRAPLTDLAVAFRGVSRMDVLADVASDLTVVGSLDAHELELRIAYRPDIFAEDTARSVGARLARILAALVEAPETRVRDVRLQTPREAAATLARGRVGEARPLPEWRVERLVLERALAEPERVAFFHGPQSRSYAETVTRARALAAGLRGLGVRPGQHVALALDHGLDLPVALLGALLAGAAFVPLEPRHPAARLRAVVAQVKPALVLAEPRLRAVFEDLAPTLDAWPMTGGEEPDVASAAVGAADDVAYVMFTSGSTGAPRGVEISHRSLVNYLLWARDCYLGADRPGFALYSSMAFDLTLTSLFLPLVSGCSTVIFQAEQGGLDLRGVFADPRVGVVKATPSHLKLLRPEDLHGTRVTRLIVGGEALSWGTAAALQQALGPQAAIFNEYGPTEATIGCTAHRFSTSDRPSGDVPIGAPISNAGLCLLDEQGEPVPTGMTGQIYLSGVPLARGYLGAPELTRERFVEHPLEPGQRAYVTGDRARYDTRGCLYYLGRADDQVKLNGVRVELAEIRAALSRLPRVRDSVVRLLEDERRNRVLVAYYVARQPIDVSLLRAGLLEHLPQEMLPHLFMRLAKLPLTLNGKVDLERLPPLEEVRNKAPQVFAAPRTDTERVVAGVWGEVLGIAEISVHSNFFELGGHSLLASQVAWKVGERLGLEMPLRLLFDAPTIAQVAAALDERLAASEASTRAGEP